MLNCTVYFGEVVAVNDDEALNRLRVIIPGYTDKIPKDDLPWYYPFFGQHHLPIVGDTVPVIIFNGNMSTGFYNNKIDLAKIKLKGSEYENYLEIYKRLGVQLTYTESLGIEFINDKSRIQIEKKRVSIFVENNEVIINPKRIDLGTDGEATPLGDKTVKALQMQIDYTKKGIDEIFGVLGKIQKASTSPMLAPIKLALTAANPLAKSKLITPPKELENFIKTIQSKKTFIE